MNRFNKIYGRLARIPVYSHSTTIIVSDCRIVMTKGEKTILVITSSNGRMHLVSVISSDLSIISHVGGEKLLSFSTSYNLSAPRGFSSFFEFDLSLSRIFLTLGFYGNSLTFSVEL